MTFKNDPHLFVLVDIDGNLAISYSGLKVYADVESAVRGRSGYIAQNERLPFYKKPYILEYIPLEVMDKEYNPEDSWFLPLL